VCGYISSITSCHDQICEMCQVTGMNESLALHSRLCSCKCVSMRAHIVRARAYTHTHTHTRSHEQLCGPKVNSIAVVFLKSGGEQTFGGWLPDNIPYFYFISQPTTYTHTHMNTHTHTFTHMYAHARTNTHACARAHARTHTHTHTCLPDNIAQTTRAARARKPSLAERMPSLAETSR